MSARCTLAAALLLAACGGEEQAALIPDFAKRSPLVTCVALSGDTAALASITSVRAATDSTFLVADANGRQLVFYDRNATAIRRLEIPEEGPGSVEHLSDAVSSGDTVIVLADMGRGRIVGISPAGTEQWAADAGFPTQGVAFAGNRLLVAAFGMDARIPGLIHERRGERLIPLQVPFIADVEALARLFANSVNIRGLADGSAVVVHEMIYPRAWAISSSGDAERYDVPIPEGLAEQAGVVPPMPIRDEDIGQLLAPALSIDVDPASRDVLYITRSGPGAEAGSEKAIVRVSSAFGYIGSVRLPINAAELVYLPSIPDSVIVSDNELRWHRCPIPNRSTS